LVMRAKVGHSPTEEACRSSVLPLRAPRLRWSAPEILRLGKTAGAVIDALETLGGSASLEEVARLLEVKRYRDLKRRVISRLEAAGVVECAGDTVSLAGDWLEALNRERETAGEIAALRRDMARYDREREAYRRRHETKPDRAPTEEEMAFDRRERARLTEEEEEDAEAILAFEREYGPFDYSRVGAKKLFYKTGRWPDAESLRHIKDYLGVARGAA
jgi:hypothetical protein